MSSKSRLTPDPEPRAASEAGAAPPVAGSGWLAHAASYGFSFWCLAATCALLPSYNVRWRIGPLPTDLLEVAILVTLAAYVVECWHDQVLPDWRSPYALPAALFLLAGVVSVAVSPVHREALGLFRAYLLEPLLLFVMVAAVAREEAQARILLVALWLGGLAASIPNILVIAGAARHHALNSALAAPAVIYNNVNELALFVVPLVAMAGAVLLHATDLWFRRAAGLFVVFGGLGILISLSRGGYMALAVVVLLLALTLPVRWWLVPALVVVGAAFSRLPPVAARLGHEVDLNDPNNTLVHRLKVWSATLRMVRDHPIFGGGLSGYPVTVEPYRVAAGADPLQYPHNILLNFWTETGILGVVAFAWLLVQGFRCTLRGWRQASQAWRPYHLGVAIALVAIVVHGLVDVPYWKNDLAPEFWILVGLSLAGLRAEGLLAT
ncbi:MAG: O-antigen ligase family protein [Acidimicrobiaceae bacterium]|nr:O-antigen ligase family protein [Acidimicrobiaceae bacterium]